MISLNRDYNFYSWDNGCRVKLVEGTKLNLLSTYVYQGTRYFSVYIPDCQETIHLPEYVIQYHRTKLI